MMFITFTMLFSGGLIPTYLVVKSMGLIDTRWALLIPNAIWVWQVIIARTFFRTPFLRSCPRQPTLTGAVISDLFSASFCRWQSPLSPFCR